jgi:hypothetical protein
MRKSDPTITNNVIPFPKRPKNRSSAAMASSPQSVGQTAGYRHYKSSSPFQPPLKPTAALEGRIRFTNSWHFWRCLT